MAEASKGHTLKRHAIAVVAFTTAGAILASINGSPTPRFIWNVTASVPIGLYGVRNVQTFAVNDIVIAIPPEPWARILADRRLLPHGTPLIKRVAAISRQTICRFGLLVFVDGILAANAHASDACGRSLPVWQGCATIENNEIFLMNSSEPASFDGRYFGPIPTASIEGRATPLWTFKTAAPKRNCETSKQSSPESRPSNPAQPSHSFTGQASQSSTADR
jgi:conjugative transfer signal peptidase TraF